MVHGAAEHLHEGRALCLVVLYPFLQRADLLRSHGHTGVQTIGGLKPLEWGASPHTLDVAACKYPAVDSQTSPLAGSQ